MTSFKNMACHEPSQELDQNLLDELSAAGIPVLDLLGSELIRELMIKKGGEVPSPIRGDLHDWFFKRNWYYWVAEGPGIDSTTAESLHARFGKEVRVGGHCGCPSPTELYKGFAVGLYHIDTQEGLKALADTIKEVRARAPA